MTKYRLNFWKNRDGSISRIYVNADDRSSLGYIERNTTFGSRGEGAYDRHRAAKGDTTTVERDQITWTLEKAHLDMIVAAIEAEGCNYTSLASRDYEPFATRMDLFQAMKKFTPIKGGISFRSKDDKRRADKFSVEI